MIFFISTLGQCLCVGDENWFHKNDPLPGFMKNHWKIFVFYLQKMHKPYKIRFKLSLHSFYWESPNYSIFLLKNLFIIHCNEEIKLWFRR